MHLPVIFLSLLSAPTRETDVVQLAQMTVEQRVIIRIPLARQRPRAPSPDPPIDWKEKKGPKCVPIRTIRAAAITAQNGIDMLLTSGERYRGRLERGCRSIDFLSGFYIQATQDGDLCAGRDAVQARGGTECEIDSFKRLEPDE